MALHRGLGLIAVAALALTAAGCASVGDLFSPPVPAAGVDFAVEVVDRPAQHRFELTFTSLTDASLCLPPEQWPNASGKIAWASQNVSVEVAGRLFRITDWNGGVCIDGCTPLRVDPHGKATAFLAYSDFQGLEPVHTNVAKTLRFTPRAEFCGE
jgi:hypothetical protein